MKLGLFQGAGIRYIHAMKTLFGLDRTLVITLVVVAVLVAVFLVLPEPAPWAVPK